MNEQRYPSILRRGLASATLLGAAGIHIAVVPEHFEEWPLAGWFFVALAVAELAAAGFVWSTRPAVAGIIAAMSLATVALWAVSRTAGLPFGPEPWTAEAVGPLDLSATVLEIVTAAALTMELVARRRTATELEADRASVSKAA